MEEIIEFYTSNGSPVFLVQLSASRAFDRVEYCKLFQLLIDRNMCPMFLTLLLYMYTHEKWNGICSELFDFRNGVKQGRGNYFSFIILCVYIEVHFERLRLGNVGCDIGNVYVSSVGYADEECVMGPSCNAVHKKLSVFVVLGQEYNDKFN